MTKTTKPLAQAIAETTTPAKRARKTRQPIKALAPSPETVAKAAKADADRKKASKKALRESLKPTKPAPAPARTKSEDAKKAEHEAYIAALRIDAEALGVDPDTYIAEQLAETKTGYTGPMLALRRAVVNYVKAENGQPCCGDDLAQVCGRYTREQVVAGLIVALQLPGNPYAHLNPGQQSMNLRNKARTALKNGTLTTSQIAQVLQSA